MEVHRLAVTDSDPGALLPPVLEGVEAKERLARHVLPRPPDSEHTARVAPLTFAVETAGMAVASGAVHRCISST